MTSRSTAGDGYLVQGLAGFRWAALDFAVRAQYANLGKGAIVSDATATETAFLSAANEAYDVEVGFNSEHGGSEWRTTLGVRYAIWDSAIDRVEYPGDPNLRNEWWGVGPRAAVSFRHPLTGAPQSARQRRHECFVGRGGAPRHRGLGLHRLHQCEHHLGQPDREGWPGLHDPSRLELLAAYDVQWWDDVNVAINDDTDFGGNVGTSGYLLQSVVGGVSFKLN